MATASRASSVVTRVRDFWFRGLTREGPLPKELMKLWFFKDPAVDSDIRERFLPDIEAAGKGEYSELERSADGSLTLVVLLDQFPRNVFRGTPRAFACDGEALRIARQAVEERFDEDVHFIERMFFYMPFEHAEDLEMQRLSVAKFQAAVECSPEGYRPVAASFLDYAKQHEAIIERFGRYPHRNTILGRESTPEEVEHLKSNPGF